MWEGHNNLHVVHLLDHHIFDLLSAQLCLHRDAREKGRETFKLKSSAHSKRYIPLASITTSDSFGLVSV